MKVLGKAAPALVGMVAGAALIGFAFPALGRDDPPRSPASTANAVHVTSTKAFGSKSAPVKLKYVSGSGTVEASATATGALTCPKKTHAISGFFGSATDAGVGTLGLSESFPGGKGNRSWGISVKNLSAAPQEFFVGAVCVK